MTDHLRAAVSRNKRRYKCDGYNLDLSYIEPAIIAMGYPAENLESMYRNQIDQVAKFLNEKHKDRYKIYNLCKERKRNNYPKDKFTGNVCDDFSFEDHAPPPLEKIEPFCRDVHEWLSRDSENVVAVHCKAGKGRTGVMICCYLLHCGRFNDADEALRHYAKVRTIDEKGVTIPSQRRYVEYYARMRSSSLQYENTRLMLRAITFDNILHLSPIAASLGFTVYYANRKINVNIGDTRGKGSRWNFEMSQPIEVYGDVRIEFYVNRFVPVVKEKICAVGFNTFFIEEEDVGTETASSSASQHSCQAISSRPSSVACSLTYTGQAMSQENGRQQQQQQQQLLPLQQQQQPQQQQQQQQQHSEPPSEQHLMGSSGLDTSNSSNTSCGGGISAVAVAGSAPQQTDSAGVLTGGGGSGSCCSGGGTVSGPYRVLTLTKSQLDKACKTKEFPETGSIRLLFDASVRHSSAASGNGNGSGGAAGSGSGSEERRSEGGSPAEEDDSSEEDETSCVRM